MANPFVAEIRVFGFNFPPRGWAHCNGQLLPISQNTALFSLLGTTFGGNGKTTFALPNLDRQFAMAPGAGPGLSLRDLGETTGQESVSLQTSEVPPHTHTLRAGITPNATSPAGNVMAPTAVGGGHVYRAPNIRVPMAAGAIGTAGSGAPHENRQPYLAVNFCIAMQGIFPARP